MKSLVVLAIATYLIVCISVSHGFVNNINIDRDSPDRCNLNGTHRLMVEQGSNCTIKCSITVSSSSARVNLDFYEIDKHLGTTNIQCTNDGTKRCNGSMAISANNSYIHCLFTVNNTHQFYTRTLLVRERLRRSHNPTISYGLFSDLVPSTPIARPVNNSRNDVDDDDDDDDDPSSELPMGYQSSAFGPVMTNEPGTPMCPKCKDKIVTETVCPSSSTGGSGTVLSPHTIIVLISIILQSFF